MPRAIVAPDHEVTVKHWLGNWIRPIAWSLLKGWIRRQFPTVPSITPRELADWRSRAASPPVAPQIIDTRQAAEFAVSHLPDARHIPTLAAALNTLRRDAPVVAYCSVGYRSARLAAQLQAAGFTQVYNLEGSLFQWANEGRSLVHHQGATQAVHPYSATWGHLLAPTVPTQDPVASVKYKDHDS